jgi:hypothetical protein
MHCLGWNSWTRERHNFAFNISRFPFPRATCICRIIFIKRECETNEITLESGELGVGNFFEKLLGLVEPDDPTWTGAEPLFGGKNLRWLDDRAACVFQSNYPRAHQRIDPDLVRYIKFKLHTCSTYQHNPPEFFRPNLRLQLDPNVYVAVFYLPIYIFSEFSLFRERKFIEEARLAASSVSVPN